MGIVKREMEREEGLHRLGVELCLKVGALAECENHPGSYYDGGEEVQEAYKLANTLISAGEIDLDGDQNRRTITDAIQKAYDDNRWAEHCTSCEKALRED